MATTNLERNQNRKRQALKRQRDRVETIERQAKSLAGNWPTVWRDQFLQQVKRRQAGAAKANAEVEKTAAIMPEGSAREAYVRTNYRTTKVSLTREKDEFLKRKKRACVAEVTSLAAAYEGYVDPHDERIDSLEHIDLQDPHEVAFVLEEDDILSLDDFLELQQSSIFFGGRGVESLEGFRATIHLLRTMQGLPAANLREPDHDTDIGAPQLASPDYGL